MGAVNVERLREALGREASEEILQCHAQAAHEYYLKALEMCPPDAAINLGPLHSQLGILFDLIDQTEKARIHNEQAVQIFVQAGDYFSSGKTRYNMAIMYQTAANRNPTHRRDLLHRARAYAQAALYDFKFFKSLATDWEAQAQQLIATIDQALAPSKYHSFAKKLSRSIGKVFAKLKPQADRIRFRFHLCRNI